MVWRKIDQEPSLRLREKAMYEYLWAAKPDDLFSKTPQFIKHMNETYNGIDKTKIFVYGHIVFVCGVDSRGTHTVITIVEKGAYISAFKIDLAAVQREKAERETEFLNSARRSAVDLARRERHHNRDLNALEKESKKKAREDAEKEAERLNQERKKWDR